MRILIVGGSGHIGEYIATSLRLNPEFEVAIGGRSPDRYERGVLIDVQNPDTFNSIDSYDAVINCADTYQLNPVPLFDYCMRNGKLFVETTADTSAYMQLYEAYDLLPLEERRGVSVMGLGIFPGLSNIVAGNAVRNKKDCNTLNLHLSWSVFSGAGAGTCEVMVQALARPRVHIRNGEIANAAPLGNPQSVTVFERTKSGFELGLPEPYLLFKSLKIANASTIVSTRPAGPNVLMKLAHWLSRSGIFKSKFVQFVLRHVFRFARVRVLRTRSTPLKIAAVAESTSDSTPFVEKVNCHDAFQAAAETLLCCLSIISKTPLPNPGVYTADQLFTLKQFREEVNAHKIDNIYW